MAPSDPNSSAVHAGHAGCDRSVRICVAAVWLALATNALWVVWQYGSALPFYDDWLVLAAFGDSPPGSWSWVFEHHNGHVFPVQRIATASVWMLNDGDLRPLLISSVGLLAASAGYSLYVLRRVRGRTRFEDVVVPLALLGSHAYADAMWAVMWVNVLAAAMVCAIATSLVWMSERPRPAGFFTILAATSFLAYQGAPGLLYAIGLAPAIAYVGWRLLGALDSARDRLVVIALAVLAGLCVCAVLAYEATIVVSGEAGMASRSRVAVAFFHMLAHGLGQIAKDHLALCSWLMFVHLAVVAGLAVNPTNRRNPRAIAAAAALCPAVVLCAAIAVSRVGGSGGFTERYVGMVMPIWASLQMASVVIAPGGVLGGFSRVSVLLLAVSTGMTLASHGAWSKPRLALDRRLEAAVSSGQSVERIAANLSADYQIFPPEKFAAQLRAVKSLGRGFLAHADDTESFDWRPLEAIPTHTRGCEQENGTWIVSDGSRMWFAVPPADEPVDAVRVTFECEGFPWSIAVAGGALSSQDDLRWGPSLAFRRLFPVGQADTGGGLTYTTTFAFDRPTAGFVFSPPEGSGRMRFVSVEAGRSSVTTADR